MKSFISLLFMVGSALLVSSLTISEINDQFEQFKVDFSKTYPTRFDEYKAKKNFIRSLKFIEAHNQEFDSGEHTYSMSINAFSDRDPAQMRKFTGTSVPIMPASTGRAIGIVNASAYPTGPDTVDWRTSGCISPIKDQSYFCNACWAFR